MATVFELFNEQNEKKILKKFLEFCDFLTIDVNVLRYLPHNQGKTT